MIWFNVSQMRSQINHVFGWLCSILELISHSYFLTEKVCYIWRFIVPNTRCLVCLPEWSKSREGAHYLPALNNWVTLPTYEMQCMIMSESITRFVYTAYRREILSRKIVHFIVGRIFWDSGILWHRRLQSTLLHKRGTGWRNAADLTSSFLQGRGELPRHSRFSGTCVRTPMVMVWRVLSWKAANGPASFITALNEKNASLNSAG